jgi:hypothetical protein
MARGRLARLGGRAARHQTIKHDQSHIVPGLWDWQTRSFSGEADLDAALSVAPISSLPQIAGLVATDQGKWR